MGWDLDQGRAGPGAGWHHDLPGLVMAWTIKTLSSVSITQ